MIYDRALKAVPDSYKLWHAYLRERLEIVRNLPINHPQYENLNNTFERALVTMHKMPRIWVMYLLTLTGQKLISKTRRTFDRALCALPVTQHDRIWEPYLWQEAAERLASVLNDQFYFIKGKTKNRLWLELCDLLTTHATEVSGLNVDAIIRGGIRKFTDEEGMTTVVTVRDFSVIFDAYSQFEGSTVALKMENMDLSDEEKEDEEDIPLDVALCKSKSKFEKKIFKGFLLHDDNDVDLRLARVKLFEGNPTKQILTYTEAVRTIDPMKAVGKPHTLWVAFAKLYETYKDLANARVSFDKAVQVNYKTVDHLASVWAEWAEMELRHKNFKGALELMRRATAEPSVERYGKSRLERARELFEHAVETAPSDGVKPLYLQYAKLEEDFGLAKRAMKKDHDIDEAKDKLKQAGVSEDEMAALERHLLPAADNTVAKDNSRKVGFVSAGVESQADGGMKSTANLEDIDLPKREDGDDSGAKDKGGNCLLCALERIKRQKLAQ
ncbi:putative ribonuclease H protein [Hibiscus syriacus]|uniref:Ribonuclease H protein n=1 Tax=Hibiscus syriacus TaxID=106335 RepID=A0A6A2WWL9_HIBSY|nr:putative ribonuclease H protein [Hibiscus syriacus]